MSRLSYEAYGERARLISDPLLASARMVMRRENERLIVGDIAAKLRLVPKDRLLDIGCGIGNLTIPLSFLVAATLGIDNADCIARLRRRLPEDRIRTLEGYWPDVDVQESFSKILIYDAIHYLSSLDEVRLFIEAALKHLEAGGSMLIGDLPSVGHDDRFSSTRHGQEFNGIWNHNYNLSIPEEKKILNEVTLEKANHLFHPDENTLIFNDTTLLQLVLSIRTAGFDAYVVSQDADLPLLNKREDILVRRPR